MSRDNGTMQGRQVEVRLLGPGDAAVFTRCAEGVLDDQIDWRRAREFLADPRHHLAAAIIDGVVVGLVSAVHYVHPDKSHPELWINEVGVAEAHRRQGLGRRLLEAILEAGRAAGCREAWVLAERGNQAAVALYRAAGASEPAVDQVMLEFKLG